jgi:hypothetical protein
MPPGMIRHQNRTPDASPRQPASLERRRSTIHNTQIDNAKMKVNKRTPDLVLRQSIEGSHIVAQKSF